MPKLDQNFNFHVPLQVYKGKAGEWRVKGLSSTEHLDLQGEIVRQNSLDITALNEGKGLFNWDHKEGPENIIGVVDSAEIKEEGLFVEGYLFKNSDRSKAVHDILTSLKDKDKNRLQMSIEGKILRRTGPNGKDIAAAKIEKVALTFDPVNPHTYAELVKSLVDENNEVKEAITPPLSDKVNQSVNFTAKEVKEHVYNAIKKAKGGEGSRGGKVIGRTQSGKPIYDSHGHSAHKEFTTQDHHDAANANNAIREKAHAAWLKEKRTGKKIPKEMKDASDRSLIGLREHMTSVHAGYSNKKVKKSTEFTVQEVKEIVYNAIKKAVKKQVTGIQSKDLGKSTEGSTDRVINDGKSSHDKEATFTYDEVIEVVKKALAAGGGVGSAGYNAPPSELADGTAMTTESMGDKKKKKKKKKVNKNVMGNEYIRG